MLLRLKSMGHASRPFQVSQGSPLAPVPANAQAIFGATCPVVSTGFWENGNPIKAPSDPDAQLAQYRLTLFPDGLASLFGTEMLLFANCSVSAKAVSCSEVTKSSEGAERLDPDIKRTIDLDRMTGALHATTWRNSAPALRRDDRGTCTFDEE
jgi:hypothetical protein